MRKFLKYKNYAKFKSLYTINSRVSRLHRPKLKRVKKAIVRGYRFFKRRNYIFSPKAKFKVRYLRLETHFKLWLRLVKKNLHKDKSFQELIKPEYKPFFGNKRKNIFNQNKKYSKTVYFNSKRNQNQNFDNMSKRNKGYNSNFNRNFNENRYGNRQDYNYRSNNRLSKQNINSSYNNNLNIDTRFNNKSNRKSSYQKSNLSDDNNFNKPGSKNSNKKHTK